MNAPFQFADWHVYAAFGLVLALGFVHLVLRLWKLSGDYTFANEFREKFITYCKSQGQDQAAYNWLMRNSNRMQTDMGEYGIYSSYKPPFANYAYKNYPIILNMLPELRSHIEPDFGRPLNAEQVNSFRRAIDEALLRYIGVMEEWLSRFRKQLLNPFFGSGKALDRSFRYPLSY